MDASFTEIDKKQTSYKLNETYNQRLLKIHHYTENY